MIELLRTTDVVFLSFVQAMLAEIGVEAVVFDAHISAMEGGINAFPRRVMVAHEDLSRARMALFERGYGEALR